MAITPRPLSEADYHHLMTRVLLAEDDASISEPLARALRREGYEVEVREDGPTALDAGIQGGIDLCVLDLGLPGMDGLEVARRLRAEGHTVPILILTARADEVDTVVGLDCGRRRLRHQTLPARRTARPRPGPAPARCRRARAAARHARRPHRRRVAPGVDGDEELQLTAKEFDLLRVLVRDAGRVVTRDQLMREVWDTTWWSSTKTLDMHISWLRKKLGDDAANPGTSRRCGASGSGSKKLGRLRALRRGRLV